MNASKIIFAAAMAALFLLCTFVAYNAGQSQRPATRSEIAARDQPSRPDRAFSRNAASHPLPASGEQSPTAQDIKQTPEFDSWQPPSPPGNIVTVNPLRRSNPSSAPKKANQASSVHSLSSNGGSVVPSAVLPSASSATPVASSTALSVSQVEEDIVVPLGARLPAALLDQTPNLTPQQASAVDAIANDFLDDFPAENAASADQGQGQQEGQSQGTISPPQDAWDAAAREANERYRGMFGVEAYNAWTSASAQEALAEKQ